MTWYRRMYLPNTEDCRLWSASPIFAPLELIAKSPKTWIGVAEQDILAPEAMAYADLLCKSGVLADVKVYVGATHSILALDGVLTCGKLLVADAAGELDRAFHGT
jgi:acetyl esterase/lipase